MEECKWRAEAGGRLHEQHPEAERVHHPQPPAGSDQSGLWHFEKWDKVRADTPAAPGY